MYGAYLILVFVLILFAIGGVEATMRFFAYVDLEIRYAWIRFRMSLMRRKLEKQLSKDTANIKKILQDLKK
jgi:hypothetical protein